MSRVKHTLKSGRYVAAAAAVVAGVAYMRPVPPLGATNGSAEPVSSAVLPAAVVPMTQFPVALEHALSPTAIADRQPALSVDQLMAKTEIAAATHATTATMQPPVIEAARVRADIKIVPRVLPSPLAAVEQASPGVAVSAALRLAVPTATADSGDGGPLPETSPAVGQRPPAKREQLRRKTARAPTPATGCVPFVWPGDHGHPDRWKPVCGHRTAPPRKI
jgi:hypothetical protein